MCIRSLQFEEWIEISHNLRTIIGFKLNLTPHIHVAQLKSDQARRYCQVVSIGLAEEISPHQMSWSEN